MAISSSTGASASGKSHSYSIPHEPARLIEGVVRHSLVSAATQVTILQVIDETGSASIDDIVVELPGHPDPVEAILIMVELDILTIAVRRVLDGNSIVRRADPSPDPEQGGGTPVMPRGGDGDHIECGIISKPRPSRSVSAEPASVEHLVTCALVPHIVIGTGTMRASLARMPELHRPGVYALLSSSQIYVGTGADVGHRVAFGKQPIENIDTIVVITDASDTLTEDDAKAAERMLWSRVAAARNYTLVNGVPGGASVSVRRYSELDVFLASACLTLRHNNLLFTSGSARSLLAGPRTEPGRAAPPRPFNQIPDGDVLELAFSAGHIALAARRSETDWILLRGSDVRVETVSSASATTRFLRAAWLHSGLLEVSPDGQGFVTTRDLTFASGSGLSQFVTGAKGRTLGSWQPVAPDGGYDANTATLIAR